jgi:hypothetical protein
VENVRPSLSSIDETIIVIDDGGDADSSLPEVWGVTVLRGDFAANRGRMNNSAAARATADILLCLDAGVEATGSEWLREMIGQVSRPEVAVVGARLWSAEGILQHGGFILGLGGIAAVAHAGIPRGHAGFFNRPFLQRNCAAVSSDCCAVRTEVFREVGGFDEQYHAQDFQDVDFCLRASDHGLQVVWTPYANLVLHGSGGSALQMGPDADYLRQQWGERLNEDPFYSPSLSLALPGFELAFPPRWLHARR